MSAIVAPVMLAPRRFASWRSHPVKLQFCGKNNEQKQQIHFALLSKVRHPFSIKTTVPFAPIKYVELVKSNWWSIINAAF